MGDRRPPPSTEDAPAADQTAKPAAADEPSFGPMPEHRAPPAAVKAAKEKGYGEPVARLLSNLARTDGQDPKPTEAQLLAVTNWLDALSALKTPEDCRARGDPDITRASR